MITVQDADEMDVSRGIAISCHAKKLLKRGKKSTKRQTARPRTVRKNRTTARTSHRSIVTDQTMWLVIPNKAICGAEGVIIGTQASHGRKGAANDH